MLGCTNTKNWQRPNYRLLHTGAHIQPSIDWDSLDRGGLRVTAAFFVGSDRERMLSLIRGGSDNIDIPSSPSCLHFVLTWSFKGSCQTKVVFSKGPPQACLGRPSNNLWPTPAGPITQTHSHWVLFCLKCQHVVYLPRRWLCWEQRGNMSSSYLWHVALVWLLYVEALLEFHERLMESFSATCLHMPGVKCCNRWLCIFNESERLSNQSRN